MPTFVGSYTSAKGIDAELLDAGIRSLRRDVCGVNSLFLAVVGTNSFLTISPSIIAIERHSNKRRLYCSSPFIGLPLKINAFFLCNMTKFRNEFYDIFLCIINFTCK